MLERKEKYAVELGFLFVELFIDRRVGFRTGRDFTRLNVQCSCFLNKMLVNYRNLRCVAKELSKLQPEKNAFKRLVRKTFAPHCMFGWFTSKTHHLYHLVRALETFESIYFTEAELFVLEKGRRELGPKTRCREGGFFSVHHFY